MVGTAVIELHDWSPPRYSIVVGDTRYVFPPGTTREHAESVLAEAQLRAAAEEPVIEDHDPGDEDRR